MTTIAWDGTTLAGDKQTNTGGTPSRTRKVFKVTRDGRTFLYGCAGNTAQCQEYSRWVRGEITAPTFTDLAVMAIDERGRLWLTNEHLIWELNTSKKWAMGSGAEYALGAMLAGADAATAVRIASKLNTATGLGVDWVRF